MWRRRKTETRTIIVEIDSKLESLDLKLEQIKAATANLSRAAVAASNAEKTLRSTVGRAEGTLAALRRANQGR